MGKNNKRKTTEEFKHEVENFGKNEFSVLGEYVNTHTKIKIFHKKCNRIFEIMPTHFLSSHKCPLCSYDKRGREKRKKHDDIKKLIEKDGKFKLISEYKTSNEKVLVRCLKCNKDFEVRARYLINNYTSCPFCNVSKGEQLIENWLISNRYSFEKQYRISECRNIRPLPFDFKVNITDKRFILIEYDGRQHFDKDFRNGKKKKKDTLEEIQKRDKIKDDFCKKHNIPLLRISYTEKENTIKILKNYIDVQRLVINNVNSSELK